MAVKSTNIRKPTTAKTSYGRLGFLSLAVIFAARVYVNREAALDMVNGLRQSVISFTASVNERTLPPSPNIIGTDNVYIRTESVCVNADSPDDDCIMLRHAKFLADYQSPFQHIEVADTRSYDRCMFLDRVVQFCESDNDVYTSNIVDHAIAPFVNATKPIDVQIVGGGDGWVSNHLFDNYASLVNSVTLVDIDPVVADITSTHFEPVGETDSFTDSRVQWIFADAGKWLREEGKDASVEMVIIDCTDHTAESSKVLYTVEFYANARRMLKAGGKVVQQMNTEEDEYEEFMAEAEEMWKAAGFRNIKKWSANIPSFGGTSVFWMADA